jgi:hypothetical protein
MYDDGLLLLSIYCLVGTVVRCHLRTRGVEFSTCTFPIDFLLFNVYRSVFQLYSLREQRLQAMYLVGTKRGTMTVRCVDCHMNK